MSDHLHSHEHAGKTENRSHEHEAGLEHSHNHPGEGTHGHGSHSHVSISALSDPALATKAGIRTVKVSLAVLFVTALFQVGVAMRSGSVALLADTIHNFADALTAIPLWLAFSLSRRLRNTRYTYGYGRAEDLAGAAIVTLIFISALEVF